MADQKVDSDAVMYMLHLWHSYSGRYCTSSDVASLKCGEVDEWSSGMTLYSSYGLLLYIRSVPLCSRYPAVRWLSNVEHTEKTIACPQNYEAACPGSYVRVTWSQAWLSLVSKLFIHQHIRSTSVRPDSTMATRKAADHTLYHLSPKGFWKKFRELCFWNAQSVLSYCNTHVSVGVK
jgi:hypothetical protein